MDDAGLVIYNDRVREAYYERVRRNVDSDMLSTYDCF